jgi:hypothetical protein
MVHCQFFLANLIMIKEEVMKIDYQIFENEITEIITICQLAIIENKEDMAFESIIAQIKNVIIPEMESLLAAIRTDSLYKYIGKRLNSAWYVMDTWDFDSVLGKKILSLNNHLN